MDKTFEEAYAKYQAFLAKLDQTDDIAEKNQLFRQLTQQLAELERQLNSVREPGAKIEECEITYWI